VTTTASRLVGVYDADGGLVGEVSYVLRAAAGAAHCSLCDITHGRLRERSDWRSCRDGLGIPFDTVHRNEQPPEVRAVTEALPAVVAVVEGGTPVVLLGPDEIGACAASPVALVDAVEAAAARHGVALGAQAG